LLTPKKEKLDSCVGQLNEELEISSRVFISSREIKLHKV
jgi:hypothetical protein